MSSEELGDLLMVLWQRWRSASPVRKGAITREQYWVLRTLSEGGPMKITDLASTIGCTPGSASVTIKRLEKAGLVRRERSEKDERVVTVTLGKQGVRRLDAWRGDQLASMTVLFDSFSSEEKRALRDLLTRALTASGDLPMQYPRSSRGVRR